MSDQKSVQILGYFKYLYLLNILIVRSVGCLFSNFNIAKHVCIDVYFQQLPIVFLFSYAKIKAFINKDFQRNMSDFIKSSGHTSSPNFFGGSSDENEKVLGKFLARLRRVKKGVPKFLACGGLFFDVEALKTVKNR